MVPSPPRLRLSFPAGVSFSVNLQVKQTYEPLDPEVEHFLARQFRPLDIVGYELSAEFGHQRTCNKLTCVAKVVPIG
jgi:hypothetical protein